MKKISIMLLAALMLFAFVACDDNGKDDDALKLQLAVASQQATVGGKQVSALQDAQAKIENEVVTATPAKIESAWTEFGAENNTGYFLAFKVTSPTIAEADFSKVTMKKGNDSFTQFKMFNVASGEQAGVYLVVRVADSEAAAGALADATYTVTYTKDNDSYPATLKVNEVTIPSAEV